MTAKFNISVEILWKWVDRSPFSGLYPKYTALSLKTTGLSTSFTS